MGGRVAEREANQLGERRFCKPKEAVKGGENTCDIDICVILKAEKRREPIEKVRKAERVDAFRNSISQRQN